MAIWEWSTEAPNLWTEAVHFFAILIASQNEELAQDVQTFTKKDQTSTVPLESQLLDLEGKLSQAEHEKLELHQQLKNVEDTYISHESQEIIHLTNQVSVYEKDKQTLLLKVRTLEESMSSKHKENESLQMKLASSLQSQESLK